MLGDFFYKEKMNDLTRSRCEYLLRNNRLVNDWNTVVEQLLLQNQPKTIKKKRKKKNNQEKVKSQHILLLEQKLNGVYYKYLYSGSKNLRSFRRLEFMYILIEKTDKIQRTKSTEKDYSKTMLIWKVLLLI